LAAIKNRNGNFRVTCYHAGRRHTTALWAAGPAGDPEEGDRHLSGLLELGHWPGWSGALPTSGPEVPRAADKPPFMTYAGIARKVTIGGPPPDEIADLFRRALCPGTGPQPRQTGGTRRRIGRLR